MQRVILVEPDPALREWCRLHLEAQKFAVLAFDDAHAALQALRLDPPDLLIVATDLPAGGGFALVAAMRSALRAALVPVLFLVPGDDAEARAHALSIEPNWTVTKPLGRSVLLKTVEALLQSANKIAVGRGIEGVVDAAMRADAGSGGAGLMLESRDASVLVVVLRNFVSLARAMSAKPLDTLMRRFMSAVADLVAEEGGWIVRADATHLVILFEDGPKTDRPHATRAIESALRVLVAARRAKKAGASQAQGVSLPDLSVGCGVHSGEVLIARLPGGGHLSLTIAGLTADLAHRLDGRAKGLGWSIAGSEAAVSAAGGRFQLGRRATLTDSDHGATLTICEVVGFNPGFAKPGELPQMTEAREAVLANTMLATLAGDVDQFAADKTIMVSASRRSAPDASPELPDRRLLRGIGRGRYVSAHLAVHLPTERQELVKLVRSSELTAAFVTAYLDEYRRIAGLDQRNMVVVHEVGEISDGGYVAVEYLPGGRLLDAIRRKLAVGQALKCLAEMCLALDTVHRLGLFHGALGPEHFLFRQDGVLVMADFNVTERVSDALGLARESSAGRRRRPRVRPDTFQAGARLDFRASGRVLYAMLTGEEAALQRLDEGGFDQHGYEATRLPLPLSPLQPCLDGLLGVGSIAPTERAEDVLVELLALKDVFPFDLREVGGASLLPARVRRSQ